MTIDGFTFLIKKDSFPVILLEGGRTIPVSSAFLARQLGAQLARQFPTARFRSGNAKGSDQAFSEGLLPLMQPGFR